MIVTVEHMLTGETVSKELDVTQEQLDRYRQGRELIQNVFPHLSPADREFIKTGITQEEWDKICEDDTEGVEDEGCSIDDAEALASAGRGTDEDYRPADPFDDVPF